MKNHHMPNYWNNSPATAQPARNFIHISEEKDKMPEILLLSTYPPRECGIATFSSDLIHALDLKFHNSFILKICPLESENEIHTYPYSVQYRLNTDIPGEFSNLAASINDNDAIKIVVIQHEFGLFAQK
jgi:hypothetical protein